MIYNKDIERREQMGKNKKRFRLLGVIVKLLYAIAALIIAIAKLIDSLNR